MLVIEYVRNETTSYFADGYINCYGIIEKQDDKPLKSLKRTFFFDEQPNC